MFGSYWVFVLSFLSTFNFIKHMIDIQYPKVKLRKLSLICHLIPRQPVWTFMPDTFHLLFEKGYWITFFFFHYRLPLSLLWILSFRSDDEIRHGLIQSGILNACAHRHYCGEDRLCFSVSLISSWGLVIFILLLEAETSWLCKMTFICVITPF